MVDPRNVARVLARSSHRERAIAKHKKRIDKLHTRDRTYAYYVARTTPESLDGWLTKQEEQGYVEYRPPKPGTRSSEALLDTEAGQ